MPIQYVNPKELRIEPIVEMGFGDIQFVVGTSKDGGGMLQMSEIRNSEGIKTGDDIPADQMGNPIEEPLLPIQLWFTDLEPLVVLVNTLNELSKDMIKRKEETNCS